MKLYPIQGENDPLAPLGTSPMYCVRQVSCYLLQVQLQRRKETQANSSKGHQGDVCNPVPVITGTELAG